MKPSKLLRATLLVLPFAMISLMIVVFGASSRIFGIELGWHIGMAVYVLVFGIIVPRCILGSWKRFASLFGRAKKMPPKEKNKYTLMAFVPVFMALLSGFSLFRHADIAAIAPRIPVVIMVAFAHEVIWRGLYMFGFRGNQNMAVLFPAAMWALWSVAPSVIYEYGGFIIYFAIKYFIYGLIWGYYAHRAKSIRVSFLAHVIWAILGMMGVSFMF